MGCCCGTKAKGFDDMRVDATVISTTFPGVTKKQMIDYILEPKNWAIISADQGSVSVQDAAADGSSFTVKHDTDNSKTLRVANVKRNPTPDIDFMLTVNSAMSFDVLFNISEEPVVITRSVCNVRGVACIGACCSCCLAPNVVGPIMQKEYLNIYEALCSNSSVDHLSRPLP